MASVPQAVAAHPNASVASGLGGLGILTVWLLGRAGVVLSGEESATISGGVTSVGLLIGKRGFRGLLHVLWRGNEP